MNNESAKIPAMDIAEQWHVFPCNPLDKKPLTRRGFLDATRDQETILRWWTRWPNAMIGAPTGAINGFWVVDPDVPKSPADPDGVAAWQSLADQYGVPVTRVHKTPSGGRHYLFQWDPDRPVRNSTGTLPRGIDVRGEGGYVVIPPSQMADGRSYTSNEVRVIARAPDWLYEMVTGSRRRDQDFEDRVRRDAGMGVDPDRARQTDREMLEEALFSIPSEDYDTWYRVAGAVRRELGEGGRELFHAWSRRSRKYDARDCERKWQQAADLTQISAGTLLFMADEHDASWRERYAARLRRRQTGEDRDPPPRDEEREDPPPTGKRYTLLERIDYSDWDHAPVPRQEWAVPDRVPMRGVALFTGEGSAGKSTLQLQLSAAHVLGRQWLGVQPRQGPAIFFDSEDDRDVIHLRLNAVMRHYDAKFTALGDRLHLISMVGKDAILGAYSGRTGIVQKTKLYDELLEMCGDIRPVSIGIASSADVFAGDEVSRSQVRQFVGLLTRLAIVSGGAVTLIAHPSLTGISSNTGLSGSTQWHNSVRARMYLRVVGGEADPSSPIREIQFKKNNYGPVSASVVLRYRDGLYLPVEGADGVATTRLGIAKNVFVRILRRFVQDGRSAGTAKGTNYAPSLFAEEREAREHACGKEILAEAMRSLLEDEVIVEEEHGRADRRSRRLNLNPRRTHGGPAEQEDMPF